MKMYDPRRTRTDMPLNIGALPDDVDQMRKDRSSFRREFEGLGELPLNMKSMPDDAEMMRQFNLMKELDPNSVVRESEFRKMMRAVDDKDQIEASNSLREPADDITSSFAMLKKLDPGSVLRESEFRALMNNDLQSLTDQDPMNDSLRGEGPYFDAIENVMSFGVPEEFAIEVAKLTPSVDGLEGGVEEQREIALDVYDRILNGMELKEE